LQRKFFSDSSFKKASLAAYLPFSAALIPPMPQWGRRKKTRSRCHSCSAVAEESWTREFTRSACKLALVVRKRNESPFYSFDKIDTTRRGSARINVKKGAVPHSPRFLSSAPLSPLIEDGRMWAGRINTARRNFQRVPIPSLL